MNYAKYFNPVNIPQSQPIPGKKMVKNDAGGFTFKLDAIKQLERFLILGTQGGSYYCSERKMVFDNHDVILKSIASDPIQTLGLIGTMSSAGRAPKNDPAIFALAVAANAVDPTYRPLVIKVFSDTVRTSTHLFQFMQALKAIRGKLTGRFVKRLIASWYDNRDAGKLAYQMTKYKTRVGWSHGDALRVCHAKPKTEVKSELFKWATKGLTSNRLPPIIHATETAKSTKSVGETVRLIKEYGLTREMLNNAHLKDVKVWDALLQKMPITAMIRNLGNMSKAGLLGPLSNAEKLVVAKLEDVEVLKKGRVHPLNVLFAQRQYMTGHSLRGSGTWPVNSNVVDALETAFYKSFDAVEPTGKNFYFAVDISGSMSWVSNKVCGTDITAREAAAVLAMVGKRTEKNSFVYGFSHELQDLKLQRDDTLAQILDKTDMMPMGGTDIALPMLHALKAKIPVDVFVIITDNETWYGSAHAAEALKEYRRKMKRDAKLVVMGMTATEFTVADPSDPGMLDVVGFDTSVPTILREFALY